MMRGEPVIGVMASTGFSDLRGHVLHGEGAGDGSVTFDTKGVSVAHHSGGFSMIISVGPTGIYSVVSNLIITLDFHNNVLAEATVVEVGTVVAGA